MNRVDEIEGNQIKKVWEILFYKHKNIWQPNHSHMFVISEEVCDSSGAGGIFAISLLSPVVLLHMTE